MITYTPEQMARLRRDPLADLDAEHEAIVELLSAPPQDDQDIKRCLRSRSRWRRLDAIEKERHAHDSVHLASQLGFAPSCRINGKSLPVRKGDANDPVGEIERTEKLGQLELALNRLPEDDRSILHARYFDGQRLQDVASNCGCTVQSAHTREKRALKHLQLLLAFSQRSDQ